jgi:ubiquinone/menaquinone biosynthesis C-methylase UbiE
MGSITVALAIREFLVTAMDMAAMMVASTASEAAQAEVLDRVQACQAELRNMPFANDSFAVVLAVGVLPWVASWRKSLMEMGRVLRPGGYIIVTTDNRYRLTHLLHPRAWPRLVAIKTSRKKPLPRSCSLRAFDSVLLAAGFQVRAVETLGFGPFWLLDKLLSNRAQVRLHRALQYFSDRHVPLVRAVGAHHIVIAQKIGL